MATRMKPRQRPRRQWRSTRIWRQRDISSVSSSRRATSKQRRPRPLPRPRTSFPRWPTHTMRPGWRTTRPSASIGWLSTSRTSSTSRQTHPKDPRFSRSCGRFAGGDGGAADACRSDSEGVAKTDVESPGRVEGPWIGGHAKVESNQAEGGVEPGAGTDTNLKIGDGNVADLRIDISHVDESHAPQPAVDWKAQFTVQHKERRAALRSPQHALRAERIFPVPSHGVRSPRVKAFAGDEQLVTERPRESETSRRRHHESPPNRDVVRVLREVLEEFQIGANPWRRKFERGGGEPSTCRIEGVIAMVPQAAGGEACDLHREVEGIGLLAPDERMVLFDTVTVTHIDGRPDAIGLSARQRRDVRGDRECAL